MHHLLKFFIFFLIFFYFFLSVRESASASPSLRPPVRVLFRVLSTPWSVMRPDLYNYHTALISVNRLGSNKSDANQSPQRNFRDEARGQPSAKQCCISWNKGFCSSDHKFCRYRHSCSYPGWNGSHRLLEHNRVESGKRNRSLEREHNARYRQSK